MTATIVDRFKSEDTELLAEGMMILALSALSIENRVTQYDYVSACWKLSDALGIPDDQGGLGEDRPEAGEGDDRPLYQRLDDEAVGETIRGVILALSFHPLAVGSYDRETATDYVNALRTFVHDDLGVPPAAFAVAA